jgi:hypothetical protein
MSNPHRKWEVMLSNDVRLTSRVSEVDFIRMYDISITEMSLRRVLAFKL